MSNQTKRFVMALVAIVLLTLPQLLSPLFEALPDTMEARLLKVVFALVVGSASGYLIGRLAFDDNR